jgi:hypothetical protein
MKKTNHSPLSAPGVMLSGALLVLTAGGAGAATGGNKDILVIPHNPGGDVQLQLHVNKSTVRIGDEVRFYFTADRSGYATLWDVGTSGKVHRIFPNPHSGESVGRVEAGRETRAGTAAHPYRFKVGGPTGMEDVYLVWSRSKEAQPSAPGFRSAAGLSKALKDLTVEPRSSWATAKVTFEITDTGSAEPRPLDRTHTRATVGGNVYILAMGANVGKLTKTNADARHFAERMSELFSVPGNRVKVYENVRKRQFREGMEWLQRQAGPGDLVFIFFSGHGSNYTDNDNDEADGLDEVFVTYDVQLATFPTAGDVVLDDEFARWVNALNTDRVVSVLDTCHSGGLYKDPDFTMTGARTKFLLKGGLGAARPAELGLGRIKSMLHKDLPGGVDSDALGGSKVKGLVLAAAQEDEKALEVSGGGLFVSTLLQEVGHGGSDLMAVFQRTRESVKSITKGKQIPTAVGDHSIARGIRLQ